MNDKPNLEKVDAVATAAVPRRAPYRRPAVVQLGSIRDLTLSGGWSGTKDGAKKLPNRTGRGGRFDADGLPV